MTTDMLRLPWSRSRPPIFSHDLSQEYKSNTTDVTPPLMEHELLTIVKHLSSPPVFVELVLLLLKVSLLCFVDHSFSFFFCPFYCLSFDLRFLITSLVSSNLSWLLACTLSCFFIWRLTWQFSQLVRKLMTTQMIIL